MKKLMKKLLPSICSSTHETIVNSTPLAALKPVKKR